jgi:hypothetical protein
MYKSIKLWFRYNLLRKKLCNQRNIIDYSIKEERKKYVLVVDDKMPEYNKIPGHAG